MCQNFLKSIHQKYSNGVRCKFAIFPSFRKKYSPNNTHPMLTKREVHVEFHCLIQELKSYHGGFCMHFRMSLVLTSLNTPNPKYTFVVCNTESAAPWHKQLVDSLHILSSMKMDNIHLINLHIIFIPAMWSGSSSSFTAFMQSFVNYFNGIMGKKSKKAQKMGTCLSWSLLLTFLSFLLCAPFFFIFHIYFYSTFSSFDMIIDCLMFYFWGTHFYFCHWCI